MNFSFKPHDFEFFIPANCMSCQSICVTQLRLCQSCRRAAFRNEPSEFRNSGLNVTAATTWIPDENRALSLLLKSLKGNDFREDWAELAREFVARLPLKRLEPLCPNSTDSGAPKNQRFVLVPAPASSEGRLHALHFAEGIAQLIGLEVFDVLRHRPSGQSSHQITDASLEGGVPAQKARDKKQRKLRTFYRSRVLPSQCIPIIVDDIVTSGGTAHAAWQAFGRIEKAQVWCFAHRQLDGRGKL